LGYRQQFISGAMRQASEGLAREEGHRNLVAGLRRFGSSSLIALGLFLLVWPVVFLVATMGR